MNFSLRRLAVGILATGAFAVAAPSFARAEVTDANVAEKVATAKTAVDHTEIAAYYTQLAAEAGAKVKLHEQMREHVKSVGKPSASWTTHCNSLIAAYKSTEKEAAALAKAEEALAKSAK